MPHRRSSRSIVRRSLRRLILCELRRSSLFDRDSRERILLKPVAVFDRGEVLYGTRYTNPVYRSLLEGDIYEIL